MDSKATGHDRRPFLVWTFFLPLATVLILVKEGMALDVQSACENIS
jgi:hypothetical protein